MRLPLLTPNPIKGHEVGDIRGHNHPILGRRELEYLVVGRATEVLPLMYSDGVVASVLQLGCNRTGKHLVQQESCH